ncbi:MAG: hypothetical protein V4501_12625 [Pseudomonadota bacterium]
MVLQIKSDITSMMIRRDDRTLDLSVKTTDADAFQIAHALKHLPENLQTALISDAEKLAAFLPIFFEKTTHPKGYDFCYAYKIQQTDHTTILTVLTHQKPETASDFFALALAINNQSLYHGKMVMVCDEQGERVDEHTRKIFIYSLLQDAALSGHKQAAQALANLEQDARANNYFCRSRFNFLYSYKNTNKFIFLSGALTTPEQFFELAHAPTLARDVFVYANHKILGADGQNLNEFIFNILSDAAKAGHLAAKRQLIDATIEGNAAARKFVTFARYNPDLPILLPRLFVTASDFYKLSISLITHGKYMIGNNCALEGPFYIVPEGNRAEGIGYQLRKLANNLQREEDNLRKAQIERLKQNTPEAVKQPDVDKPAPASQDANDWTSYWTATHATHQSTLFHSEGKARKLLEIPDETPAFGVKNR